ncbi:hypothetical protein CSUI_007541, partial [Cystoisospora suis]
SRRYLRVCAGRDFSQQSLLHVALSKKVNMVFWSSHTKSTQCRTQQGRRLRSRRVLCRRRCARAVTQF